MSPCLLRPKLNEENSNGTLSMTYTMNSPAAQVAGILADASTTNPATGTYRYYTHDNLGSTRRLRASDKSSLGAYEYTPYGQAYATSGVALGSLAGAFTGKAWDDTSQLYYFPYRYYSPDAARWLTRDPLGMVDGPNVYAYVKGDPVGQTDQLGLSARELCFKGRIGSLSLTCTAKDPANPLAAKHCPLVVNIQKKGRRVNTCDPCRKKRVLPGRFTETGLDQKYPYTGRTARGTPYECVSRMKWGKTRLEVYEYTD